ncbi:MAG TPA: SHOCT domain-containing protein [Euryarchaeota archaeon]|nr:SHOCT domain-containing protein [Euryarchaeota archaeon]
MHYAGSSGFLGFRDFGLAFWILVALLVYILISNSRDDEEAIEILNKRFARGEISREEYMMLKREIMAKDSKTE